MESRAAEPQRFRSLEIGAYYGIPRRRGEMSENYAGLARYLSSADNANLDVAQVRTLGFLD